MLKALRELFSMPSPSQPPRDARALRLACAVLLVEVMRADPEVTPGERSAVLEGLRRRFAMPPEELSDLLGLAERAAHSATDFHRFTSEINAALDQPAKMEIVETLWQVAFADGHLDAHENHLISRIAGLLHVTHGEYIAAKLHAKQAAGLGGA